MSTPIEHPFISHQPPATSNPPPPTTTSNLSIQAQSDELKYQTKYRELRYKVKAIEAVRFLSSISFIFHIQLCNRTTANSR